MMVSIFLCILSIFNSKEVWAQAGEVGQPTKFLSLVATMISWLVIFAICTFSLEMELVSDWVEVMLLTLIVRI